MGELISWTHTLEVLQEYADKAAELYKGSLREHGRVATSQLIQSVRTEVVCNDNYVVAVDMHLANYWKYVEWDTKPHWTPPGVLIPWIEAKVIPHPNRSGPLPSPKTLDFLIRRKIAQEGTEGTHDLQMTVELLNKEYRQRIEDAVVEDVGQLADVIIRSF